MLKKILEKTREHLLLQQKLLPMKVLRDNLENQGLDNRPSLSLHPNLLKKREEKEAPAVIAEIKRASPSKGKLCDIKHPGNLAKSYQDAGAAAISVLTEANYFHGSFQDFTEVKNMVSLPVLRKDFIISPYQIYQSKKMKADIILLIIAALTDQELKSFHQVAHQLDLQCLLEVHDREELDRVKALNLTSKNDFIGINNRDLKTMKVDIQRTEKLSGYLPREICMISESGIRNNLDCIQVKNHGASGVLVGETLLTHGNPGDRLRSLRGVVS